MVTNVGYDAEAWIERLREVNQGSKFTASERALIEDRLRKLQDELRATKSYVEDRDAPR